MKNFLLSILTLLIGFHATAQILSTQDAFADMDEFVEILERESSYLHMTGYDYKKPIKNFKNYFNDQDSITSDDMLGVLKNVLGNLGDRHASIKFSEREDDNSRRLPFSVVEHDGKILALAKTGKTEFKLLDESHPYLKSINGETAESLLDYNKYRHMKAPIASKRSRQVKLLRYIETLLLARGQKLGAQVSFVLTDGTSDKKMELPLSDKNVSWRDVGDIEYKYLVNMMEKYYKDILQIKENKVAYIALPKMVKRKKHPAFFAHLIQFMERAKESKGLVIDLRGNGGGSRDLIQRLVPYLMAPDAAPWVANVAKVRSDQRLNEDMASMQGRYLYSYESDSLNNADREAIDTFMSAFKTDWAYDESRFSEYYYMVLSHQDGFRHYHYDKPVYVLVNQDCFSAASIFASAVKGLPNVKLVGIGTDGSSGRSQQFKLKHSGLVLKLSSMIAFQRNGKTLDMNGTEPDVLLERDMDQILGKRDSQLEQVMKMIVGGE